MWVRKKIEISGMDLARGLLGCVLPADRQRLRELVERSLAPEQSIVCLSVRSGFDLLLRTAEWPEGSEVLMSGLTIPDMPRIVRHHRLIPVGVDVDPDTLAPHVRDVGRLITPRTKALVVAHLFGGRVDMGPLVALAREHGLLLIEDCAQAYVGNHYAGDPEVDVSLFSFGPIKTNTALGGGLMIVRQPRLLHRLRENQQRLSVDKRRSFAKRIVKYAAVRLVSTRLVAGAIAKGARLLGSNHDLLATNMARGFPGGKFFEKIRKQPSTPLLRLLVRKLRSFDPESIHRRTQRGFRLAEKLCSQVDVLGDGMLDPTFWVFPILVKDPAPLVERLWSLGYDATSRSSLVPVNRVLDDQGGHQTDALASDAQLSNAHFILQNLVFLPYDASMSEKSLDVMVDAILDTGSRRPSRPLASRTEMEPVAAGAASQAD
jgi:dTDP-4-amino-4,6-dideoxygalactose transaminase